jgi:hypothetical protein
VRNNWQSTVDIDLLEKHLKKCNKKPKAAPTFYSLDTNMNNVDTENAQNRVDRPVEGLFEVLCSQIETEEIFRANGEQLQSKAISNSSRHAMQNVSLNNQWR